MKDITIHIPELIFVEGGTFLMGSTAKPMEQPIRAITVQSFWIGKLLVSIDDYDAFCAATGKEKPADHVNRGPGFPVNTICWNDADQYCGWLSQQTGQIFRLPFESEWEFAARGGNLSKGYTYAGSDNLSEVCCPDGSLDDDKRKSGLYKPNELGIHDLSGLLSEFCLDEWMNNLSMVPANGGPYIGGKSTKKVLRNASIWTSPAFSYEIPRRYGISPKMVGSNYGFRVVLEI